MKKSKHHYVPKFYLKHFSSATDRINVFLLQSQYAIENVGLRHQCYRDKFYGQTEEIEEAISRIESDAAPLINEIVCNSTLPDWRSSDHYLLLRFIALQSQRTLRAAENLASGFNGMRELVLEGRPRTSITNVDLAQIDSGQAIFFLLAYLDKLTFLMSDMSIHLAINNTNSLFITSDNPLFRYNFYCEKIEGISTVGYARRGLQLFLPISPRHSVMLYDNKVYKYGKRDLNKTIIDNDQDVLTLNRFQLLNASKTILFSNWSYRDLLAKLSKSCGAHRKYMVPFVQELFSKDGKKGSSILQISDRRPNLRLALSFLSTRRAASRVDMSRRISLYRVSQEVLAEMTPKPPLPERVEQGLQGRTFRPRNTT